MKTKQYEVVRPWFGVTAGEVVTFKDGVPKSLKPNVRSVLGGGQLDPATPSGDGTALDRKKIIAQLKKAKIEFDSKETTENLAALLPSDSDV